MAFFQQCSIYFKQQNKEVILKRKVESDVRHRSAAKTSVKNRVGERKSTLIYYDKAQLTAVAKQQQKDMRCKL